MNLLFYSKKCIFSINLEDLINKEDLNDLFIKINIDNIDNRKKFQSLGLDKIPTIITKTSNTPLFGKVAFEWINNLKYFHQITNNINYSHKIIDPKIISDIDKLAYNKEVKKISDSYTDIDDKEIKLNKNQLAFNKINENVPITNNNKIEYKIKDNKIGDKLEQKIIHYNKNNELIDKFNTEFISITNIYK